ncbi:MAG: sulfurtransferase [Rhodoferax sp.]|nr:sulfurtransferase [Rhodoferax sp.]
MIDQIRPSQLQQWIAAAPADTRPVVLDVREPHELQVANVSNAGFNLLTIPMSVLGARLQELDPEQPIACLCHHGGRSMQVAMYLSQNGFASVANIAGGIDAWSVELDPSIARY